MSPHITSADLSSFSADFAGLRDGGKSFDDSATRVEDAAKSFQSSWQKIDEHYQSPHLQGLDAKINPLTDAARSLGTSAQSFRSALDTFAFEIETVLQLQGALKLDVEDFEADVRTHHRSWPEESWYDDWHLYTRDEALSRRLEEIRTLATDAEDSFCRKVREIQDGSDIAVGLNGPSDSMGFGVVAIPNWAKNGALFKSAIDQAALQTLRKLAAMGGKQLAAWAAKNKTRMQELTDSADATVVADWWKNLPGQPASGATLIAGVPLLMGGLNGLPPLVRVDANKNLARERRLKNAADIADLQAAVESGNGNGYKRIAALEQENAYLLRAINGGTDGVQLYLYDPDRDRLIEMLGNPTSATHRLNWVPGTQASLDGFYNGSLSGLPRQLAGRDETALIFVLKDGTFPQFTSIEKSPANAQLMIDLGRKVADFEAGMDAAGYDTQYTTSVGHSAGLPIVAASESHGAHVDAVLSLSGAGMDSQWAPDPATKYYDFTPDNDAIRAVRDTASAAGLLADGTLGFPLVPTDANGFVEIDPNIGTDLDNPFIAITPNLGTAPGILFAAEAANNHNTVTSEQTSDVVRNGIISIMNDAEPKGRRR